MNAYIVNAVDVNDVWFQFPLWAASTEDTWAQWEQYGQGRFLTITSIERVFADGSKERVWDGNDPEEDEFDPNEEYGDGMSDVEADADTLRNAGWGTDEDYGYYGDY